MTECVDFEDNRLTVIVRDSGLEKTKADIILAKFQNYFELAADWERKARTIVVTSDSQKDEMKMARTGRLLLREKRLTIENARKELKEQALREGKAIDGIANVLKALIVPIEEYLERQEKFTELRITAEIEQKRIEDERKAQEAEQKRLAEEASERERMRLENDKLRKEAAVREVKIAEERREQEKILAAERAKADAERKEIERKALEERRAIEEKARIEREKAEKARKEAEAVAKAKADAERKERERLEKILKNTVTCPHCNKKFQLNNEEDF